MIDGFPLSFFLPLLGHGLAGLTTGVTGVMTFRVSKGPGRHHRWGQRYLWAYSVVFLTATILSAQHWEADAYLFFLAGLGYSFALVGYIAQRFRQTSWVRRVLGARWTIVHIVGLIGSYVILWTAFYVDNAHLIPGLDQLPSLTFWVLPSLISLPFLRSRLSRFAPKTMASSATERNEEAL